MSVTESFTLPAQPGEAGGSDFVPLGGDGWTSPQSMHILRNVVLTSDASGGTNIITISTDPRFSQIVPWVQVGVLGAAAAEDFTLALVSRQRQGQAQSVQHQGQTRFTTLSGGFAIWSPPPVIDVDQIICTFNNTDGDAIILNSIVYNYRLRASEKVPISVLLDVLPRGHAATP